LTHSLKGAWFQFKPLERRLVSTRLKGAWFHNPRAYEVRSLVSSLCFRTNFNLCRYTAGSVGNGGGGGGGGGGRGGASGSGGGGNQLPIASEVGLYKLHHPVYPQLAIAWFPPLHL
jgi:hypothetical protein